MIELTHGTRTKTTVSFIHYHFVFCPRPASICCQTQKTGKSQETGCHWQVQEKRIKISRRIVNFALVNGVGVIRMEDLTEIRNRAKSKKEAGRNLYSWAFYQLKEMIKYKAEMVGIRFELVKPDYTSQTCKCGYREKANRNSIELGRCPKRKRTEDTYDPRIPRIQPCGVSSPHPTFFKFRMFWIAI
jgi:IS605 OrfB family transposase